MPLILRKYSLFSLSALPCANLVEWGLPTIKSRQFSSKEVHVDNVFFYSPKFTIGFFLRKCGLRVETCFRAKIASRMLQISPPPAALFSLNQFFNGLIFIYYPFPSPSPFPVLVRRRAKLQILIGNAV